MSKKSAKNVKVESLADRYSFGHKAISVALSVVLLGFGFPAVNPSEIYAAEEATQEAAQTADAQGDLPAAATQTQQADASAADAAASAENAAVETQETPAAEESTPEGSTNADAAQSNAQDESATEATTANEADVKLELNNGYITYKGQKEQKYALPATKATVSTKAGAEDFKFSATADEGYELNKVTVTVNGTETELTADADDIYTVALNDVIAGATVKLVTTKKADAATQESATEIATSGIVAPASSEASKNEATKNESSESSSSESSANKLEAMLRSLSEKLGSNTIATTSLMSLDSEVETASLPEDTDTDKYVYVGDTVQLEGTKGSSHSWSTSDKKIATVAGSNATGTVTGVKAGEATITHTYYPSGSRRSGISTETFIIHVVEKTPATGIAISGDTTVDAEDSIQLNAAVSPEDAGYKSIAWSSSNEKVLTVDSNGKVTGVAKGTATVTAKLTNSDGSTYTATQDIAVTSSPFKIKGDSSVEQFKATTLTAKGNGDKDVTWTVDNAEVATITQAGVLTGVSTGTVKVAASYVDDEGNMVSATKDVEITASSTKSTTAYLFFVKSPTDDPDSNTASGWLPAGGSCTSLNKITLNLEGVSWTGKNSYSNVANRVVSWPDGSTGSTWELPNSGDYATLWSSVFANYKTQLEKEAGYTITEDDVTGIYLHPYKISNNSEYHLDCKVEIKVRGAITATFYLQDAGSTGFAQVEAKTYKLDENNQASVAEQTTKTLPAEKTLNGVKYKLYSWYTSSSVAGTPVEFPYTASGNVSFYAKYVPQDQAITVKYVDSATDKEIADRTTLTGLEKGQKTTQAAKTIAGYNVVGDKTVTLVAGTDSEYTFYYEAADETYTVNYYVNGTTTKVADSKTATGKYGATVSESPISIEGYTAVSSSAQSITLGTDETKNVINVYYYINSKLTANSDSVIYNASEQSVTGYSSNAPESTTFNGITLEGGKGTNAGDYAYSFADGTIGKVSSDGKYIVSEVENGNLHISPVTQEVTIKVTGNKGGEKYNGNKQTVSGYEVSDLPSGVSKDDVAYSGTASITKTDAGTYAMGLDEAKFALSGTAAANYTNVKFVVEDGELAIAKRAVTLSSEDGHKNYDGKTLQRRTNIKVTGDGFVGDDGVLAKEKLTWYDENNILPGTYENKFDPAYTSSTNINNYEVTLDFGELVVNAREDKDKYEVTVTAASGTKTYNGQEQSVSGVAGTTYTNDKGAVYTIEGLSASVSGTDAGTYSNKVTGTAVVRDEQGNDVTSQFKVSTVDGTLTINKKDATITAGSASKQYDGTELTTNEFSTDGFVDGQGIASVEIEGSQTTVGNSASSVKENSWKANEGTNLNNYNISTANGTLTVTNRDAKFEIALQANGGESTYNGSEQTVSGLVSNTFVNNGQTYTVSGLTVGAAGTNAGTYATTTTGTAVVKDANGNDVSDQFNITVTPANLVIGKKAVTLRSADLSKKYDGTALTNGDAALATNEGFVEGQGITPTFTGSQTAAGTSNNTFSYVANEGTNLGNYNITATPGTLTVEQSDAKVVVTIVGNASTMKYNGSEQSVTGYKVNGITVDGEATTLFTESDVQFTGEASAARTNAGTTVMGLTAGQFSSINANFKAENVTFDVTDGSIVVNPREVTLTSADDSKTYDGNALTNNKVTVGGDGFVNGEGATYDVTGTITNAGTAENAFTYTLTGGATEGEGGNYVITKVPGTLTVNPVSTKVIVTIGGNKVSTTYDGDAHAATGYTTSIDNTLYKESDFAFDGTATVEQTNAGIYAMGLQVGQFRNISGNFTNVEFVVTDGELAIAKRAVTLQSASDEKYYDGDPLTNHTVSVSKGSFVKGQGFEATVTGTRTLVGTSENTYTYELVNGATSDNYTVTQSAGTLTVKNRDAKWGITVEANSGEFLYDGTPHTASGLKNTTFTFNNKTYTVSGLTATATATDAGTYDVNVTGAPVVKDADGVDVTDQFSVGTKAGKLTINKRTVKITSVDATREYNGEALTAHEAKVEGDGFAKGEGATYNYSGTITNVGEASNDFEYTLNAGTKANNYNISTDEGTLTVTPLKSEVVVTIKGNTNAATYDGGSHTASGYEVSISNNLYKQGDIAFNGSSTVSATDVKVNAETGVVEAYAMGLASNQFSNNNVNFDNVKFVVENDGALTINKRTVNLMSESAEKAYDGTALTKPNVTVDGDGFVAGEVSNLKATGSVLNNGDEATNTIVYDKNNGYKDANYTVNKTEGTLKITPAQTVEATWNIGTGLEQKVYDGTPLKPYEATATDSYGNALTVEYSLDGINWYTDRSQATITHFGYAEVMLRARSDNYAEGVYATASESIMVTARPVWITSESASKAYDGQPLTNSNVSVVDKGAGTGFVSGEGADIKATGTITNVGTTPNTITVNFNEGTNSADYNIRKTEGTLTVTDAGAVVVTIAENSGTAIYDGTQHSVTGYEVKSITIGDAATTLYTEDDFSFGGDATVAGTDAGTYDMQLKASDFTNNNTNFSNVTFVIEDGTLAIAKRDVELGSGSQEFTYNGQAQTLPTATGWQQDGDKGFVIGEVSNVYASGSVTNVGDTATNTVVWTNGANFKAGNYNISRDEGTLSVKAKSIVPGEGVDMSVTAPADVKYNGQSQQQKPVVKDGNTTLVEGKDYELEYSSDTTNAGTVTVTIKGKGNYTGETTTTYQITVRNVTLTSATDTKAYDGSPLTNSSVVVSGDGFVQGEGASYDVTGSQTVVGGEQGNNTFSYKLNDGTLAGNYSINTVNGTLTVTPSLALVTVTITENSGTATYDGTEHTATGYQVKSIKLGDADTTLYKASDFSFSGDAAVAGTDAGTYDMQLKEADFTNNNGNFSNVKFVIEDGTLVVSPRPVTITSATLTQTYNGNALTNGDAALIVSGQGFVGEQGVTPTFTGSQTVVGSSANAYSYAFNEGTKAANYTVTKNEGTLNVTSRDTKYEVTVKANSTSKTYDGNTYEAAGVETYVFTVEGNTYTVSGLTTEDPSHSDAGHYTNNITGTAIVTDAAGNNVTSEFTVHTENGALDIAKANVSLKSADLSKVYDATPLVNGDTALAENTGFVAGQGINVEFTGSRTEAGVTEEGNTFTWTAKDGTNLDNYNVSAAFGNLTVTTQHIDPDESSVTVDSPENVTYDGKTHQWKPTVKDGDRTLVEGKDYTVEYNDGADFVNAGDTITVTIKGEGNYDGTVVKTYKINPKGYTVTTGTASKTYDGTALLGTDGQAAASNKVEGIVEGETIGFNVTGTQTAVGTSDNTYAIDWAAEGNDYTAKASNYTLTSATLGKLTVTEYTGEIVVTTTGTTATYDGQAHGATVSVSTLPAGYTLVTAASSATATDVTGAAGVAATADQLKIVNAEGVDVTASLNKRFVNGTIVVNPVDIEITANSAEKAYDGEALTNNSYTITNGAFVGDDNFASVTVEGSQTYVGESQNVITAHTLNTTKTQNYNITYAAGALKVLDEGVTPSKVITKQHTAGTYKLGEQVQFSITAKNIYNTTKTLTISEIEGVTLDKSVFENVAPGATVTATATYTVKQSDILNGSFTNTATVSFSGESTTFDATDEVVIDAANPHLTVTKKTTSEPANGSTYALNEQITYAVTVENDGNLTVNDVVVDDQLNGVELVEGETASVGTLDPGQKATVNYVYTVTEADILAGSTIANNATASGSTDGGDPTITPGTTTDDIDKPNGSLNVTKVVTSTLPEGQTAYELGDVITYEITVTNNGNLTVNNITVTDPNGDEFGTYTIDTLQPNGSETIIASHEVTEADLRAGSVTNVATAEGTASDNTTPKNEGEVVTPTDTAAAHITVTKTANETRTYKLGETINYTITVANTGNQTATNVKVNDANADNFVEQTIDSLAPGATKTFQAQHTVTQADILAGSVVNTATAKGTDPDGKDVDGDGNKTDEQKTDDVNTTLTVVKSASAPADGVSYKLNEKVAYTITVTNNGNQDYTNVQVADQATGFAATIDKLAVGETKSFTTTHTISEADIVAGAFVNTATAKADPIVDGKGNTHTPSGDGSATIGGEDEGTDPIVDGNADLSVAKVVTNTGTGVNGSFKLGETIEYSITVTNNGNLTAKNFKVSDPNGVLEGADADGTVTIAELAPGTTTTAIVAKHVVTSDDILAGSVTNVATTQGGTTDDPDVKPNPTPGSTDSDADDIDGTLTVTKTASKPAGSAFKVGDEITFTITVTNNGNVPYSNVVVSDASTGFSTTVATLAVGATEAFTTKHVITQDDVVAGSYANTATAKADPIADPKNPGETITPSGSDTENIGGDTDKPIEAANPELTFTKVSDVEEGTLLHEGDEVHYTVTAKNSGNLTLTNVVVSDSLVAEGATLADGESATIATMEPGAEVALHYTYTVKQSDVVAGSVTNEVTATADNKSDKDTKVNGDKVTDATETASPSMVITKDATIKADAKTGDVINYTITVTNNGNVDLSNVVVTDELTGANFEAFDLAKGGVKTLETSYTVQESDVVAGSIENIATGTAKSEAGDATVTPGSVITNTEAISNNLTVEKQAAAGTYGTGDVINFAVTVTNNGNVTLSNVAVTDVLEGATLADGENANIGTMAPGATATLHYNYTVTAEDMAAGKIENTAKANGTDPKGTTVNGEGSSSIDNTDPGNPDVPSLKRSFTAENPADVTYNGQAQYGEPVVKDGNTTLVKGQDYELEYSDDVTNAGTVTVKVVGKGNYEGTSTVTYTINKRVVTITAEDGSWEYDGSAHTQPEYTIEGSFVDGEVSNIHTEGSVTNVSDGTVDNVVKYDTNAGFNVNNYTITTNKGSLNVTPMQATITVKVTGHTGGEKYNGNAQTLSGYDIAIPEGSLLTKDDIQFSGNARVTETDAGTYAMGLSGNQFSNGNSNFANVVFDVTDGQLSIAKRDVTLTSASDTKAYDGQPLTNSTVYVSGDGFVGNEGATYDVTGTITNYGTAENAFTYELSNGAKAGNYNVEVKYGELSITADANEVVVTIRENSATATYDGNKHEATGYKVEKISNELYSEGDFTFSGNAHVEATDAGTYQMNVSADDFTNTNSNFSKVTFVVLGGTLEIAKANVSLKSADLSKVYDATPLVNGDTALVENSGFVAGQGVDVTFNGSLTNAGTLEHGNTFTWVAKEGTNLDNYNVTATFGSMTVTTQSIVPGEGSTVTVDSPVDVTYDGNTHQWKPTITDNGRTLVEGEDYTVEYNDGADFVNAGDTITVTIKGEGNYDGTVVKTYKINPKAAKLITESATKVYDSTPLTNPNAHFEGLVAADDAAVSAIGTITEVGSTDNTAGEIAWKTDKMAGNYTLSYELGKLVVTESAETIVVTTTGGTFTYDGTEHGATVEVSNVPAGYYVSTAASTATARNVSDGTVKATADQLVIVNGQGSDVTKELTIQYIDGSIEITPAPLSITTGSATKAYDGTDLTNYDLVIAGLAAGDQVLGTVTGVQREVGSSTNSYSINWGNVDKRNYSISETLGTLTVTEAAVTPVAPTVTPTTPADSNSPIDNAIDAIESVLPSSLLETPSDSVDNGNNQTQIYDDDNPLGRATTHNCWVHWFMIFGMILTVLYGALVWYRRSNQTRNNKRDMNNILGGGDGKDPDGSPVATNQPAGMGA